MQSGISSAKAGTANTVKNERNRAIIRNTNMVFPFLAKNWPFAGTKNTQINLPDPMPVYAPFDPHQTGDGAQHQGKVHHTKLPVAIAGKCGHRVSHSHRPKTGTTSSPDQSHAIQ
ncbi:hypothetical protein [Hoeflea sp.]|uniref:hypothetical protein n=1 Tax=Hoeflea sp. TaxID=1940281 RepID=UPI002AFE1B08|nr:hypothetical protein [Hoeflea sp.]